MKIVVRFIGLLALTISLLAVSMVASEAHITPVESGRSVSDDCAKKRARGKKCDDDSRSNQNGNRNSNSNQNRGNSNSNSNSNRRTNQNSNSNNNRNNGNFNSNDDSR